MNNIFDIVESGDKELPAGVLLKAEFDEGYGGVVEVYKHGGLQASRENGRVNFRVDKAAHWSGLAENPNYPFKDKEPFNRGSPTTYIGYSFSDLDTIVTQEGGRFLSLKEAYESNMSSSVDDHPDREIGVHFDADNIGEFSQYLGHLLPRLGVPKEDVRGVVEDIFTKLGYSHLGIVDVSVDVPVKKNERQSPGSALLDALANKRNQPAETKVNDFYKHVMTVNMGVLMSPDEVKREVKDDLGATVEAIKSSYEAMEQGDLETAYDALRQAGEAVQKVTSAFDESMPKEAPKLGIAVYTSYFMLQDLGGFHQLDLDQIDREQVFGKDMIVETYQNWILPRISEE